MDADDDGDAEADAGPGAGAGTDADADVDADADAMSWCRGCGLREQECEQARCGQMRGSESRGDARGVGREFAPVAAGKP